MNILYLNHYAGSPDMGMEFRPYYLAQEWQKLGHTVTIVAGDFSHLRRSNPTVPTDFTEEMIDGVRYLWLQTGAYEGNGGARAKTMLRYTYKLYRNAKRLAQKYRPDVVIASSTYPLDTYAARKIARAAGAILIHEIHDMWPATLIEIGGMSPRHPFVMMMAKAEKAFCRKSDYVVSILPCNKEYLIEKGMSPAKYRHISNGIMPSEWAQTVPLPDEHTVTLTAYKEAGKFVVGYFGGHALSNALDTVLDTAAVTTDANIVFVLVGNGVEKPRLMERAKNENLTNVVFLDPIAKTAVPSLLKYFDTILITGLPSPLYRFGGGLNKMFDAMMAAKPVILAMDLPSNPIEQTNSGIKVDASSPTSIAASVSHFAHMSEQERAEYGKRGHNAALSEFSYPNLAAEFAKLFVRKE